MAPEVVRGSYDEKCDVWSCGVVLYVLLCGSPPFVGESNEEILRRVTEGKLSFEGLTHLQLFLGPEWAHVSQDAKAFIAKLMTYDREQRITADDALSDVWILKYAQEGGVPTERVLGSLQKLRAFRTYSTMQKAVLTFVAGHLACKDAEKRAREVFQMFDTNHDGQLSRDELLQGYKLLCDGNMRLAIEETDKAMRRIDINKNGTIDYHGI